MDELIQTLTDAEHEIQSLRRQNALMECRLRMFDEMMQLLHSKPAQLNSQPFAPDVVFALAKHRDRLEEAKKPQAANA